MASELKKKGIVRVAVYLGKDDLTPAVDAAVKLGFRRGGIPIQKQKEHGFANEWEANTDGIGLLLKFCFAYWQREEPKRLKRLAEIRGAVAELEKEAADLTNSEQQPRQ